MEDRNKETLQKTVKELSVFLGLDSDNEEYLNKLELLLMDSLYLILDFTGRELEDEKIPASFYVYAKQLAIISWNKEGMEGETSRSEGGVSQTFVKGIPEEIQSALIKYRRGSVIRRNATKKT